MSSSANGTVTPCRIVVLISGNGSNLQALMDQCSTPHCAFVGVISNKADAYGLQRAAEAGVPSWVVDHKAYPDRESFDQAMIRIIDEQQADLVVLAGFMRILSAAFVQHYKGRLLNIHPSLLPAYKGTVTHRRVLEAGETEHGVSVHFVTEELDGGPVIRQAVIPVEPQDTPESLAARVAIEEHKIYPEVVTWFATGRLRMGSAGNADNAKIAKSAENTDENAKVWLDGEALPAQGVRSFTDTTSSATASARNL